MSSPMFKGSPKLDSSYWRKRWDQGETQWRDRERDERPFLQNARLLRKAACELVADSDHSVSSTAPVEELRAFYAGCVVFIPLCGDTLALSFWAKEMGCNIIGVDIAGDALVRAAQEQFADRDREGQWADPDQLGFRKLTLKAPSPTEGDVTLYEGDAFAMMENARTYLGTVDVVYDRASMVAIEPDLRDRYAAGMSQVLQVHPGEITTARNDVITNGDGQRQRRIMFLITVERPAEDDDGHLKKGPPFNISPDIVFGAYAKAEDDSVCFVAPVADERPALEGENPPPFADCHYTIVSQTTATAAPVSKQV